MSFPPHLPPHSAAVATLIARPHRSPSMDSQRASAAPLRRTRASVACTRCRKKRTKCIIPIEGSPCNQCSQKAVDCVIYYDDERKRPKSRLFVGSLLDHINLLEARLKDSGREVPASGGSTTGQCQSLTAQNPIQHRQSPDNTSRPASITAVSHARADVPAFKPTQCTSMAEGERPVENAQDHSPSIIEPHRDAHFIPAGLGDPTQLPRQNTQASLSLVFESVGNKPSIPVIARNDTQLLLKRPDIVRTLSEKSTQLNYNRDNGQISWTTPTAVFNRYAEELTRYQKTSPNAWQVERRTKRIIEDLDSETHEHLMDCFWTSYNSVFHVVDEPAFYKDLGSNNLLHSWFLHICCLAMGFRFADMGRSGVRSCSLGNGHSTFHQGAKYVFESELETPRGITTIQALLILSDLECAVGREKLGWMYAGITCRLAVEFGLNVDCSPLVLTKREIEQRHQLLRACVFYDCCLSLYSGLPTVMKSSELYLVHQFGRGSSHSWTGEDRSSTPLETTLEKQIWDALLKIMYLSIRVVEFVHTVRSASGSNSKVSVLVKVAALDTEFNTWHKMLPPELQWNPGNVQNASSTFFLMHQQFLSALITLHQPFAKYNEGPDVKLQDQDDGSVNCVVPLSRTVCQANALLLVEILVLHHNKFGLRYSNAFALQHASVAILALLACSPFLDESSMTRAFEHLHCLKEVLSKLASIYQLAQNLQIVLDHVLCESRSVIDDASLPDITLLAFKNLGNSPGVPSARPGLDNLSLSLSSHNANVDTQINDGSGYGMQTFPFPATPSSIFDFPSSCNGDPMGDTFMSNI